MWVQVKRSNENRAPGRFTSKNVTAKWYRYRGPNLGTGQYVENTHARIRSCDSVVVAGWDFPADGDTYQEGPHFRAVREWRPGASIGVDLHKSVNWAGTLTSSFLEPDARERIRTAFK